MTAPKVIDAEIVQPAAKAAEPPVTQAIAVREKSGPLAEAISMQELESSLKFIRDIMKNVMIEGQDYGKVPGCGEKPCLLQPGAQKLAMTFQLTDEIKSESIKEYPGFHREVSVVVLLRSRTGRTWEGVGTCSTLESKYRYRKAEKRCPKCGKNTIIQGKAEYGGGWICWKKKGGCDAKFPQDEPAIASQPSGNVEYENPPDYWNTVRKMAFKRALVHAAINATNTSELWTQDVEDMASNSASSEPQTPATQTQPPKQNAPARAQSAPAAPIKPADAEGRARMITELYANPGQENREIATEYFRKMMQILPNEEIEDVPLQFVPATRGEMRMLLTRIAAFANGERAEPAFEPHFPPAKEKPKMGEVVGTPPAEKPIEVPRDNSGGAGADPNEEWFMNFIVPIPHKGEKRDDYLKHPDTIGSLYQARHGNDADSQEARQRLWGFVTNYEAKGWEKRDGTKMPPSDNDIKFRKALDAFAEWFEKNHPDEKL